MGQLYLYFSATQSLVVHDPDSFFCVSSIVVDNESKAWWVSGNPYILDEAKLAELLFYQLLVSIFTKVANIDFG